ncbi:response regulator transcription factor [Mucilaginibacter sp. Bleaf8]|uniref:response regulator transcription factor n=1 Tax=Mucilaginibacter sp. Bleaf8 TaxID=2834430 RepID=UPI001BCC5627|nr:response regulator transcription factor [Mucilaginibacter sp. Bleaf8]MBS7564775.1 response regulator transcription factor [Mucilaginibacter sp. Bleaf8]
MVEKAGNNAVSQVARIKIAIVDDHKLFRQGVLQILGRIKHFKPVFEAESYPQLLKELELQTPDVILMDIEIPGTDGIDGCKQILQKFPEVKIIALTMHTADNYIFYMMKAGARSYLPKDIDKETLQKAIETVYSNGFYFTDTVAAAMLNGVKGNYNRKSATRYGENPLTKRELEVLVLICNGLTTMEIAEKLFLSTKTVEGHRKNLLEKTDTSNSVSLAVYAVKSGILDEQ